MYWSDEKLVNVLTKRGHPKWNNAYLAFWVRFGPRIRSVIRKTLAYNDIAIDIPTGIQDVSAELDRKLFAEADGLKLLEWRRQAALGTYVCDIVRKTTIDFARRWQRNRGFPIDENFGDGGRAAARIRALLMTGRLMKRLEQVDDRRNLCAVLELHFHRGMSGREIAEVLDKPESTIASWKRRVRNIARELLGMSPLKDPYHLDL